MNCFVESCRLIDFIYLWYSSCKREAIKSLSSVKNNYTHKYLECIQKQTWSAMYQASVDDQLIDIFLTKSSSNTAIYHDCLSTSRIWETMSSEVEVAVKWYSGSFAMKLVKHFLGILLHIYHMAVEVEEFSFLAYTQMWIKRVCLWCMMQPSFFKAVVPHHLQHTNMMK